MILVKYFQNYMIDISIKIENYGVWKKYKNIFI